MENLTRVQLDFELEHQTYLLVQEFKDIDEAISFWHLQLENEEPYSSELLKEFLMEKLEKTPKGSYLYRNEVESVIVVCEN